MKVVIQQHLKGDHLSGGRLDLIDDVPEGRRGITSRCHLLLSELGFRLDSTSLVAPRQGSDDLNRLVHTDTVALEQVLPHLQTQGHDLRQGGARPLLIQSIVEDFGLIVWILHKDE